jgi:hypothetical protein
VVPQSSPLFSLKYDKYRAFWIISLLSNYRLKDKVSTVSMIGDFSLRRHVCTVPVFLLNFFFDEKRGFLSRSKETEGSRARAEFRNVHTPPRLLIDTEVHGGAVGRSTALQAGRLRVQSLMEP